MTIAQLFDTLGNLALLGVSSCVVLAILCWAFMRKVTDPFELPLRFGFALALTIAYIAACSIVWWAN